MGQNIVTGLVHKKKSSGQNSSLYLNGRSGNEVVGGDNVNDKLKIIPSK